MSILLKNGRILQTPITPLQLPNLKLYLASDRMYQYADGTPMPNFVDYSGNNYVAVNNTVGEQPLFKPNSFGKAAGLKFDGVNDKMTIPSNNIFQNINQYTVQIACKRTVLSELSVIFGDLIGSTTRFLLSFQANGNIQLVCRRLDLNPTLIFQYPSNDLNPHFIQCTLNPTNYTVSVYHDGVLMGNIQLASSGNLDNTPTISYVGYYQTTNNFSTANISEISVSQSYSNPSIIASQYQGWLQRTGLKTSSPLNLQNLKLYLSATKMGSLADESLVNQMSDFSGNGYHAVQANTSLQPKFKINQFGTNSGILINNGKYLESNPLVLANTNQFTVQILAKRNIISTSSYPFTMPDANNTDSILGFGWAGAGYAICFGKRITSDLRTDVQFPSNDLNQHMIQMTLNPSDAKVYAYFDGVLKGTFQFTVGIVETPLKFLIGSTYLGLGSEVNINGISINQSYSEPSIIQQQYQGYLQRGYL